MSFSPTSDSPPHGSIEEQRERWERKRIRISKELVQTEQKYCQQLQLITTYFVEILAAKGTLKPDVRGSIFSSIKHIHTPTTAPDVSLVVFVSQTQLKKSKAFRRFKKLQESRPEFKGQSLEELLELPLPRPVCPEPRPVLGALSELSDRIEENSRRHENQLQLQRVQRLLTGKTRVQKPGRWYIREGWLKVVPPKGSDPKAHMFFLFSDVLLQTRRSSALSLSSGERFEVRRVFPLSECAVDKVFGHTRSQGGLLNLSFPKARLLLMSSDQDDFNDWVTCLTSAVR
uniref:Uncharacterized protein n=1 Tax=Periophthalmus magnuspinnatus TaxID=409849 RepID=A0A3B3ZDM2_9GOBI